MATLVRMLVVLLLLNVCSEGGPVPPVQQSPHRHLTNNGRPRGRTPDGGVHEGDQVVILEPVHIIEDYVIVDPLLYEEVVLEQMDVIHRPVQPSVPLVQHPVYEYDDFY